MGSSLVPIIQVAPLSDPWLATPRHAITKEDSTIAAHHIWKNTHFKDPPVYVTTDNKTQKTSRFLESSTVESLRLDELLATTLGGREAPCHGGQSELEVDSFEVSCLIRKLALFGDLEKVTEVFNTLSRPDGYIWSALISAHSNLGANAQAINLYHQMVNSNATPDGHVFVAVLKACSSLVDLKQGMQIHSYIIKSGFDSDIFISNTLIGMYAKCGNLEDAHTIFKKIMHWRDAVTWSVLIAGYAELGYPLKAYGLFQQMQEEGIQPNQFTFVCVLKACSNMGEGDLGERIHSHIIENGCELDLFVGNALMGMYIKCDGFDNACTLMNKLLKRDVVTWSAIIGGYAQRGVLNETFQAFQEMQEEGIKPDVVAYVCLMKACHSLGALEQGREVHSQIIESGFESDLYVGSAIVDMYVKCENLEGAHTVFGRLSKRNAVTWNTLIGGYSQYGHCQKAYQIFQQMEQEGLELDKVTFICLVSGCSCARDLEHGKQVHCHLVQFGAELDVAVGNALIDMYSKCGSLEDACILFDRLPRQDVVTWNVLITWHAQNQLGKEVLQFFERMQQEGIEPNQVTWNALIVAQSQLGLAVNAVEVLWQMQQEGVAPDKFTFVRVLQMCSMIGALEQGMQLHNHIIKCGFESDMFVQNTLIDMYAKCDNLEAACMVFDRLPSRDVVAWNALIAGLTMHGRAQESLQVFQNMQQESVEPDRVTFVAILQACSSIAVLEHGKRIHDHITESGFESDLYVGNTLIDMYAKCGAMDDALFLFNRLPKQDEVTWSTLISGHAQHCNYLLASQCFWGMQEAGFLPNEGTYLSLLSACIHASLVNEGCFYFKSMQEDHGIVPTLEHHVALVELLGRAGYLREAEELLETLPWGSNIVGWTSLLGSCKKYGLVDLGKRCFDRLMTVRNGSSSGYVLMSSIYAHVGLDEAAEVVAVLRKHANVWKQPAKAYIEIGNQVHDFTVGDTTHPRSDEIYAKLGKLSTQLKEKGHSPHVGLVCEASSVKLKEKSLWGHSEKLAIAFGLLCTPGGVTIRVAKNLRVCADCHDVAMSISKMETRDIIIKDSHCIHHFKDGACCCNEYQ